MNFRKERIKDYYLRDTSVENIFINEYMTDAPGDYVKVYLFALMYADFDMLMSNDTIAKHLSMADEDVLKAWSYWESKGVIRKNYEKAGDKFRYQVEFINLKELVYGQKVKEKKAEGKIPSHLKEQMDNDVIRNMYSEIERIIGRLFEGKEPAEILSWITDYNATPEMVIYAYSYCVKKKNRSNHKYVAAVVKEWVNQGLKTLEQIEDYLEETDNRHYLYKRVLRALGFMRNATEEEKRIMDVWFDEMGFGIDKVLDACKKTSGISNPNINYINSILKAWSGGDKKTVKADSSGKPNQIANILKYYEELRAENETRAEARRTEVYQKIPRVKEIEEEARGIGLQISRIMLSGAGDAKNKIRDMKVKVDRLNEEKAFLMTENNFKIDYMDMVYTCPLCKDTGIQDTGERCSCFVDKLSDMQKMD
ncbi:DnaD domain protein [Sinanaerobacter chloroacetimidivorans]|jgi:DnaD/phage-associated family protein|uniref:DnaD domain protein n=1 Tax=Sinanaerobacter chloroacetimidivorans TaxID=2818044 RepID=A0A8J7W305_9FIRM|nr:DnaD domain protein [Sinanaerobacter chloroacetimidivorans]MBR0598335.1 DnaD domain protein [Sinanaerobacter chloroacetimidivorans]